MSEGEFAGLTMSSRLGDRAPTNAVGSEVLRCHCRVARHHPLPRAPCCVRRHRHIHSGLRRRPRHLWKRAVAWLHQRNHPLHQPFDSVAWASGENFSATTANFDTRLGRREVLSIVGAQRLAAVCQLVVRCASSVAVWRSESSSALSRAGHKCWHCDIFTPLGR